MSPFSGVDFQGGASIAGEIDESTVQAGDYLVLAGTTTPHQITMVNSATTLTLASGVSPTSAGTPYTIIRAPRRLPSEDIIQMPSNMVIEQQRPVPGNAGFNYCSNIPQRGLIDSSHPAPGVPVSEILFAPSGAVVGQGTQADKIYLWLRELQVRSLTPVNGQPMPPVLRSFWPCRFARDLSASIPWRPVLLVRRSGPVMTPMRMSEVRDPRGCEPECS